MFPNPVIAGIGDQLDTFINGGGIGTYLKALFLLAGVGLLIYAMYLFVKNAVSNPPKIGRGVIEAAGAILVAVLLLVAPARTTTFNYGGNAASAVFKTVTG